MKTKGIATPALIAIVAIILVLGGAFYYNTRPEAEKMVEMGEAMMEDGEKMMEEGESMMKGGEAMMEEGEGMMDGDVMMEGSYSGEMLVGSHSAPLLDFKKSDYDKAVSEGKSIVLFFYANWCPLCKLEFPKMKSAFDQLEVENVVGFRINYNDNQTDSDEKQLARDFGVAYQHTKVFVKNGERVLKSPESWDEDRYITEITNLAK